MSNIIRTETIETPIYNLLNKFKNVILDLVNHGSTKNVNELYEKRSNDIESLNELKTGRLANVSRSSKECKINMQ